MRRTRTMTAGLLVAAMMMIVLTLPSMSEAQRGAPKVIAPTSTELIQANPAAFDGKTVTLSSGVEQMVSKTSFTVDQRKVMPGGKQAVKVGKPLLVVAPALIKPVEPNTYLTIVGWIVKFDPAVLAAKWAKDYKTDLTPELAAKYQGQYILLATSIRSPTYEFLTPDPATLKPTSKP